MWAKLSISKELYDFFQHGIMIIRVNRARQIFKQFQTNTLLRLNLNMAEKNQCTKNLRD